VGVAQLVAGSLASGEPGCSAVRRLSWLPSAIYCSHIQPYMDRAGSVFHLDGHDDLGSETASVVLAADGTLLDAILSVHVHR
jgi:hypothetical protein